MTAESPQATSPPITRIDVYRYKEITLDTDLRRMPEGQPVVLYQGQRALVGLLTGNTIVRRVEDGFIEYQMKIDGINEVRIEANNPRCAEYNRLYEEARRLRKAPEEQR
jgi:hypothetical protein